METTKNGRDKIIRILITFGIGLILCLAHLILKDISYVVNDDTTMNSIALGAYGTGQTRLVFINVIIGYILKIMYKILPGVNCYLLFFLGFNVIAVGLLSFAFTRKMKPAYVLIVTLLVNLVLEREFYCHIQFTTNAYLYGVVAIVLMSVYLWDGRKNKIYMILSSLMAVLSFMTRYDCIIALVPFWGLITLFIIFEDKLKRENEKIYMSFVRAGLAFVLPFVLVVTAFCVNKMAYNTPEWKYFFEYNKERAGLIDYEIPDYNEYKEEYAALSMSENDVKMLSEWNYGDTDFYTLERLRAVRNFIPQGFDKLSIRPYKIKEVLYNIYGCIYHPVLWLVLIASLLVLIKGDAKKRIIMIIAGAGLMFEIWYLTCQGRTPWRALFGPFAGCFVVLFLMMILTCKYQGVEEDDGASDDGREVPEGSGDVNDLRKNVSLANVLQLVLVLVLCISQFSVIFISYEKNKSETDKWNRANPVLLDVYSRMCENSQNFFVVDSTTHTRLAFKSPVGISTNAAGIYTNSCELGGWTIPSPISFGHKNYGIENMMKALATEDNVYLICTTDSLKTILTYIHEHYNENAGCEIAYYSPGVIVWRIDDMDKLENPIDVETRTVITQ